MKSWRFVDASAATSRSTDPSSTFVDQRLLERLHLEELAVGDRVRDLLRLALADQVGDPGVR